MDEQRPQAGAIDVIVLVASAGGLEALSVVLGELPADLPAAVVVQQHLGNWGSQLPAILQRRIGRAVAWIDDGMPLEPGLIAVGRPLRRLELLPDGSCSSPPGEEAPDRPHDVLLTSLADSFGERGLAVVLTGFGRDGAEGVRAMNASGGLVIAQDEATSDQPSMPRAAAEAGADLVLPLHGIANVLTSVARGARLPLPGPELEAIRTTFGESGAVAAGARDLQWAGTPFGPVHSWPTHLRAVVRLVMDAPEPAVVLWGNEARMLVNDAAIPLLGRPPAQILARTRADVDPEAEAQDEPARRLALSGQAQRAAVTRRPVIRDGRLADTWWESELRPFHDPDGQVVGIVQTFHERTAEVLATRRLRTLHALASAQPVHGAAGLASALSDLVNTEDLPFALGYLVVDDRATLAGAVGVEEGSVIAPRSMRLGRGAVWPLAAVADSRQPTVLRDVEERFGRQPAGPEQVVVESAVLHPLLDAAGDRVVGALVVGIHPRLPLDAELREFVALVSQSVNARLSTAHARQRERERREQLAQLDHVRTEFFSNVSHEFRTPLTLMLAPLDELLHDDAGQSTQGRAELELIRRNALRLLRLVDNLLDFSEFEADRLRPTYLPTDLAALTTEVASVFRGPAQAAGLELTTEIDPFPEPVWVDQEMWEKIVANLLSNALKYTWHGGIRVRLRAQPMHAELSVRDTGIGIPADELPHVVKRFHRVEDSRGRSREGAGIGLSLVDELVRRHHGRLRLTSAQGVGTTATVWIPLGHRVGRVADEAAPHRLGTVAAGMAEEAILWDVAREQAHEDLGVDDQPASESPAGRVIGAHVLVVDDSADMRDYLRRLLGTTWRVSAIADGRQALALAQSDPPDLVLADVMMPRLDGVELLRQIRADPDLATTPVVLLTARAGEEAAIDGLLAGADDYIVKPFSARELVARIGAQLDLAHQRRRNDARWRAIVAASFDVVYRMSPDWTEMRALSGRGFLDDTREPSTAWLTRYIDPADQAVVMRAIDHAIRTRTTFELVHRVRRPDGTLGWTLSRAVPLLDDHGEIEEWIGTATDITDQGERLHRLQTQDARH